MSRREKLFWLSVGFVFVVGFLCFIPARYEICEVAEKTKEQDCASYQVVPFAAIKVGQFLDRAGVAVTALATIAIALFTLTLKRATDKLWDAGERQLKLSADISAAQTRDMQDSIAVAEQSATAARMAAEHVPKTERAYLFLELDIISNVEGIFNLDPSASTRKAEIVFGFRNHGRTPAIVESLQVAAQYWEIKAGSAFPAIHSARLIPIQPGLVVSSEPVRGYKVEFDVTRDQYKMVFPVGRGHFLFWGKITYFDVFQKRHETGWCRANSCDGRGWRFGGDQSLNYYT